MELLVFYLTSNGRHYTFPHFVKMINDSAKKNQWKLLILTHDNDDSFYINELKNYQINYDIAHVNPNGNYLAKVNYAADYAEQHNIPFVMKCDNDVFIKSQTLDFMIDNLHLLENPNHLTLGPVLTSGIPGIEYFKHQFLDIETQTKLEQFFLKTNMYNNCGATYDFLNKHTLDAKEWNYKAFFDSVKTMNHHYKGVHPIRFNTESLQFLNEYIINNKHRFLQNADLSIIDDDTSPYLCNSIFCIKTDTYKKILATKTLYVDDFDEVPVNKFAWQNNMNHLFVKNGFAIHMYYNWTHNHQSYEQDFCNKFFN